MTAPRSREDVVSGALIEGVAVELPVDRAVVAEFLRQLGPYEMGEGRRIGLGSSSVVCELWTVTDGRPMPRGVDPSEVCAQFAGSLAGMVGATWGGALGWMRGMATMRPARLFASALAGAEGAFGPSAELALRGSRRLVRPLSLASYHELLFCIPAVRMAGGEAEHALVLGMVTDNAVAHAIDRWFGYGYEKRMGRFATTAGERRVSIGPSELLKMSVVPQADAEDDTGELSTWRDYWSQPLLGGARSGRPSVSRLDRNLAAPGATCQTVCAAIEVQDNPIVPFLSGLRWSFGCQEAHRARAVQFRRVATQITLPRHLAR